MKELFKGARMVYRAVESIYEAVQDVLYIIAQQVGSILPGREQVYPSTLIT